MPFLVGIVAGGLSCGGDSGPSGPCLLVSIDNVSSAQPAKVTAFFTVDKCTGEPVPGIAASEIELREDGSRISALESQQRLVRNADVFRVYTLVVLDMTASIIRGNQLGAVQAAAKGMVRNLTGAGPEQLVAIYYYDGRRMLQPAQMAFTNDVAVLELAIDRLSNEECTQGGTECAAFADHRTCVLGSGTGRCLDDSTNLYGAVFDGVTLIDSTLAAVPTGVFKIGAAVFLTDGADQAGFKTREDARGKVNATAQSVFTISFGADADRDFMAVIGKTGTATASTPEELTAAFNSTAEKIKAQAGRHYLLEYCSPKRAGTHELRITVTTTDKATGDDTKTFSAAGFTSGCSL